MSKKILNQPEVVSQADQYMAFIRGWHDGAGYRGLNPNLSEHTNDYIRSAYMDGWGKGREAARLLHREAEEIYKYSPSIIRLQDLENIAGVDK